MNEGPDAEPEPAGYIRLPWPVVGAGLLLVLVALLGLGLFANRNLRPQTAAAPTAVAVEPPTATSFSVVAAPQVIVPTSEPAVIATATVPAATPAPTRATAAPATATAVPAATPRPTVSPELAAEVGNAYQQYWQVRAEALYDLDTSRLPAVMAEDHLLAAEELIAQLRLEGRAILTDVRHNYVVLQATQDQADIADEYTDDSTYVDITSRQQLTQPVGEIVKEQYQMNKIDGTWRVVSLVRAT